MAVTVKLSKDATKIRIETTDLSVVRNLNKAERET